MSVTPKAEPELRAALAAIVVGGHINLEGLLKFSEVERLAYMDKQASCAVQFADAIIRHAFSSKE